MTPLCLKGRFLVGLCLTARPCFIPLFGFIHLEESGVRVQPRQGLLLSLTALVILVTEQTLNLLFHCYWCV